MSRLLQIPTWAIISTFTLGGFAVPLLFLSIDVLTSESKSILPLAPLPAPAQAIRGFDASWFFQADPYIEAIDGQIYVHEWNQGTYDWQPTALHTDLISGQQCSNETVRLIEVDSEAITECRTVRTIGEWCPGHIVSVAISKEGAVWRLIETPPCYTMTIIFLTLTVPAGFALGVILAISKHVVLFMMRRRASVKLSKSSH
jgi:hypothetical protein